MLPFILGDILHNRFEIRIQNRYNMFMEHLPLWRKCQFHITSVFRISYPFNPFILDKENDDGLHAQESLLLCCRYLCIDNLMLYFLSLKLKYTFYIRSRRIFFIRKYSFYVVSPPFSPVSLSPEAETLTYYHA